MTSDEIRAEARLVFANADLVETVPEAEEVIAKAIAAAYARGKADGVVEGLTEGRGIVRSTICGDPDDEIDEARNVRSRRIVKIIEVRIAALGKEAQT